VDPFKSPINSAERAAVASHGRWRAAPRGFMALLNIHRRGVALTVRKDGEREREREEEEEEGWSCRTGVVAWPTEFYSGNERAS